MKNELDSQQTATWVCSASIGGSSRNLLGIRAFSEVFSNDPHWSKQRDLRNAHCKFTPRRCLRDPRSDGGKSEGVACSFSMYAAKYYCAWRCTAFLNLRSECSGLYAVFCMLKTHRSHAQRSKKGTKVFMGNEYN